MARVLCSWRSVAIIFRPLVSFSATIPITLRVPISRAKMRSLRLAVSLDLAVFLLVLLPVLPVVLRRVYFRLGAAVSSAGTASAA